MKNFRHTFDFLKGEQYQQLIVPYEKIGQVSDDYPGIYSWYVRPKPGREKEIVPLANELYRQAMVSAEIKGTLRMRYSGELYKEAIEPPIGADSSMLRNIFLLVGLPLYIGISINVNARLKAHKASLEESSFDSEASDCAPDSEDESRMFGERIGRLFVDAKVSAVDCLYVKVFEYRTFGTSETIPKSKKSEIMNELRSCETFANTLFNPVFGRR